VGLKGFSFQMIGDNFVYQFIACRKTYYSSACCTLLNSGQNVEECDATKAQSGLKSWQNNYFLPHFTRLNSF
jgi:hypothetical protein